LKKLREELVSVDNQARQKLTALALLGIHESIQEIKKGEDLYRRFSENAFSQYIRIHEFETLVNERTRNFIGRDFVFNAIDNIIEKSGLKSGYIVLSGEPGIGKTALIAQLVKIKGYVHHFNIATQGIRSTRDFLGNLCSQIIVRYKLNYATLPERATRDSGILVQLLAEAVKRDAEHRIVVLIDALDEADDLGLSPIENRLYLPRVLPDGVFFIISTREKTDAEYRLLVDNREDIYLRDDDPSNIADIQNYILRYISENKEKMTHRFSEWRVTQSQFEEALTEKSHGNFMYLVHVLRDIRDGKLTIENIENIQNLPLGLKEYYQRHWRMMRNLNKELFEKYQKPVVCILATVREPVTINLLSEWTGLEITDIKEVIDEWREFLNEDKHESGEPSYRVYHTSFQDFLEIEVGLKPYHKIIVGNTLSKIQWNQ
jgi:nucleoside-triphosphatase THEP1